MTRETKIGLLVGLAFIIVIGILLSDHINATGDQLRADTTSIYNSVEKGIGAPHAQPSGETVLVSPQPVVPQNRVRTESDNEPRQGSGNAMIVVGPGHDPSSIQIPRQPVVQGPTQVPDTGDPVNPQPPVTLSPPDNQVANNDRQNVPQPSNNSRIGELEQVAQNHNEPIESASNGKPVGISNPKPGVELVARPEGRQVVAEENDTVSKFASKYMGANNKANREAIIKANPSVGTDGSKVFAGKTYVIPAQAGAAPQTTGNNQTIVQAPQQPQQPVQLKPMPAPPAQTPTTAMYTVKENDTLWKIASEQLGSGARYSEIVELNKDVLKGNAQLRPNMRLKMPAKAVATNN